MSWREQLSLLINGLSIDTIHFVGIFGSGMSALAQFLRWRGVVVSGSDRSLHSMETSAIERKLIDASVLLCEQDGSGISEKTSAVCISTAIEQDNADIASATRLSIPLIHRSDVLAALVKEYRSIAVAGTSGKSTVTAMIFEFLTACGKSPSLISGAPLRRLEKQSLIGNAFLGKSDILVVEADESDGTLVKYEPSISLFLNISKDHKPTGEVRTMFEQLAHRSKHSIRNADDPLLNDLPAGGSFSLHSNSDWKPDTFQTGRDGGLLIRNGIEYRIPLIGEHNLSNCAAALSVADMMGCSPQQLSQATPEFEGVARRFFRIETAAGITVVDDFAHNPAKIRAAVCAARTFAQRIIAIYQPHGFGPTRFLRNEYRELFGSLFSDNDTLCLLPIYYAGGTATKDISSRDLKNDLAGVPFTVIAPASRDEALSFIELHAKSGDCIIVMGARDPSLPVFVQKIAALFESKPNIYKA